MGLLKLGNIVKEASFNEESLHLEGNGIFTPCLSCLLEKVI